MTRRPPLAELLERRELLRNFVVRNLTQRYKGSALGFLWSLLHPLLLILIYLVFIRLMRFPTGLPQLMVGVMVWQFFVLSSSDSVHAVLGHANLVKKTYFPRIILPLSAVLGNFAHFLLSLLVLQALLPFFGVTPGRAWLHLPWLLGLQVLFCLGVSLAVSSLNVFYRDVEHLLQVLLMAWFFVTPVIYPAELVLGNPALPSWLPAVYFLNPMSFFLVWYRAAFLGTPLPAAPLWPGLVAVLAFLAAGLALFSRLEPRFADEL